MISCTQCGNPCGVGAKLCRRCEELNQRYPLAPGARRWVSPGGGLPQNLPRAVGKSPLLAAPYGKDEAGYMPTMYGGTIVENLVQTAIADIAAVSGLDTIADITTPDPTPDFSGGGGDFGGGGASGSW